MAFTFERDIRISKNQYVEILAASTRRTSFLAAGTVAAAGALCLAWPYTVALGLVLLVGSVTMLVAPSVFPGSLEALYRRNRHLHDRFACGVSDSDMWIRGSSFQCRSQWDNLHVWRESNGWLVLNPHGLLPIFLPIDDLVRAGCYEQVISLASTHGHKYGAWSTAPTVDRQRGR